MVDALIINGIGSHGKHNVDRMIGPLEERGIACHDIYQPIRHAWDARDPALTLSDAAHIATEAMLYDKPIAVAHSYGGLKTLMAMGLGAGFKAVYLFRPAVDRNYRIPDVGTRVVCIHSWGDWAVWSGGLLLLHAFGWAGTLGFKDKRVINIRSKGGHNADFKHPDKWADFIAADLQNI